MISLILVSHCKTITDGVKEMIDGMANNANVSTISAGGMANGELGTDPVAIYEAILAKSGSDKILIFTELGSSVLSSEMAIDMLEPELQEKVKLVDAPLVEGAFVTAVQITDDLDSLPDMLNEIEKM